MQDIIEIDGVWCVLSASWTGRRGVNDSELKEVGKNSEQI